MDHDAEKPNPYAPPEQPYVQAEPAEMKPRRWGCGTIATVVIISLAVLIVFWCVAWCYIPG